MADVQFRTYLPYHKVRVDTPIVVTADTPTYTQMAQLVITDNLPAGEYVVSISWEWSMPDVNDSALFRVISPILQDTIYRHEPNDANEKAFRTASIPLTYAGGPITFTTEASKTTGAADLTIGLSSIEFERKA